MLGEWRMDPVLLRIGPLQVHWYGLMYLLGFAAAYVLGRLRARQPHSPLSMLLLSDAVFYGALGVVLGGRIGYVLFYQTAAWLADPALLLRVWEGGMSFHGGLVGVMVALWWFARAHDIRWLALMDFSAPLIPVGLAAGRLGNFINGELWGRVTDVPWGMVFPEAGTALRHPSPLYEGFFEGMVLFVLLWWYSAKPRPVGSVSALFLMLYGVMRFVLEFFRQPDLQLGFVWGGWMTMGQLLCMPMVMCGMMLFIYAYRNRRSTSC